MMIVMTINKIKTNLRSSHSGVFLRKGVLKICSKFTGEHPPRSVISSNFIEIGTALGSEFIYDTQGTYLTKKNNHSDFLLKPKALTLVESTVKEF